MPNQLSAIKSYISLMRLDRPVGIFLLLWPTLIALWLASKGHPEPRIVAIFVLGVIIMRSAGCVINDYADRNIDPFVARTKNRALATGAVSAHGAKLLFVLLMVISFILVMQLKVLTVYLSVIAAALATIYPYAKRVTNYPQIILGLAFSWSIPMAYVEVLGKFTPETWLLYLSNLLWVVAYDTEYALVDIEDDIIIGVKSTAIAFGGYVNLIIGLLQFGALFGFACIGLLRNFSLFFYAGLGLAAILTVYQQVLIKQRQPQKCMLAFKNNGIWGMVVFISFFVGLYP